MYNTFQRKYRNILTNANCHVTIIILQSFKVGGVIPILSKEHEVFRVK